MDRVEHINDFAVRFFNIIFLGKQGYLYQGYEGSSTERERKIDICIYIGRERENDVYIYI